MRDWQPPELSELKDAEASKKGRLPQTVRPVHYEVFIQSGLEEAVYTGYVKIDIDILQTTSSIVLHSVDLELVFAKIRIADGVWSNTTITSQPNDQTISLALLEPHGQGTKSVLWISFKGSLLGRLSGFYRGAYKDSYGSPEKYYALTQMQACDARRAIPCFDEPALKAQFSVTLVAKTGLTCLSNMDVDFTEDWPAPRMGLTAFHFNTTPRMSTYLLAFAIGDFKYIENNDFHVPIRVYTTPDRDVGEGKYAADISARTLAFYEEKFGAKYPLPKLDLFGCAARQGAMENWGLIIFNDHALLENKDSTSAAAKELIATVVLHEEAHLWFGDLVTMEWWEGLWLNESFAEWVSLYAINTFSPKWQEWDRFVTVDMQQALELDALRNSHPIEVEVETTGQINQLFDRISYQKGCSVLRMLATYLGEDVFVDGVRRYIQAHAFSNTKTMDLWEKLSEASGVDVLGLMEPWTRKIGYPIITVMEDPRTNTVSVRQNRYLSTGDVNPEDDTVLWPVFLSVSTYSSPQPKLRLEGRQGYFRVPSLQFFKINTGHTGVYRTLYTPERLMRLAQAAQSGILAVADRAGLIADSVALSISGHQSSRLTFYFIKSMLRDDSFFVWRQTVEWFVSLRQAWLFQPDDVKTAIKAAQLDFTAQKAHSLGWDFKNSDSSDESNVVTDQFKALMFTSAAGSGDAGALSAAKKMFTTFMDGDRTAIDANLRNSVFALVVASGGEYEYQLVLLEYHKAATSDGRSAALAGLGHAVQPELVAMNVSILFDEQIPFIDTGALMTSMSTHRTGAEALMDVVLNRWDELLRRSPVGIAGQGLLLSRLTNGLATEEQAVALEKTFEGRNKEGLDRQLKQQLEQIRVRVGWARRSSGEVESWLMREGYLDGADD